MNPTSIITTSPIVNRLISPQIIDLNANQPNVITTEDFYTQLRIDRDNLLAASDWTVLIDVPISKEKREQYIVYRQQLRDLPSVATPDNITWPTIPS
jgi:hypothetical protein